MRSAAAKVTARPGAAASWWFVGAGLAFGWAYLVRELTVFVFPVVLGVLAGWRLPLRRWVQVAAGMLSCLVLELVVNWWAHGDPLVRLKVGSEHGSPIADLTRTDALLRFPRAVVAYPQTVVVMATLVLTVLGALLVRRRGPVLMLGWFVSMWLPLTLVSGLIDPGFIRINASLMRYWVPVLPPLCLGAAAAVAAALAAVRRPAARAAPGGGAGADGRGRRGRARGVVRPHAATTSPTTRATRRGTTSAPSSPATTGGSTRSSPTTGTP